MEDFASRLLQSTPGSKEKQHAFNQLVQIAEKTNDLDVINSVIETVTRYTDKNSNLFDPSEADKVVSVLCKNQLFKDNLNSVFKDQIIALKAHLRTNGYSKAAATLNKIPVSVEDIAKILDDTHYERTYNSFGSASTDVETALTSSKTISARIPVLKKIADHLKENSFENEAAYFYAKFIELAAEASQTKKSTLHEPPYAAEVDQAKQALQQMGFKKGGAIVNIENTDQPSSSM